MQAEVGGGGGRQDHALSCCAACTTACEGIPQSSCHTQHHAGAAPHDATTTTTSQCSDTAPPPSPRYQDYQAEHIPTAEVPGAGSIRVMAGSVGDVRGPVKLRVPGMLLDVRLDAGGALQQPVGAGHLALVHQVACAAGRQAKPRGVAAAMS